MNCLKCVSSEEGLTNHNMVCLKINGEQNVDIPKKGSIVKFNNYRIKKKFKNLIGIMLMYLTPKNTKSILLVVLVTSMHDLTIDLINQCKHIELTMQFTSLLSK